METAVERKVFGELSLDIKCQIKYSSVECTFITTYYLLGLGLVILPTTLHLNICSICDFEQVVAFDLWPFRVIFSFIFYSFVNLIIKIWPKNMFPIFPICKLRYNCTCYLYLVFGAFIQALCYVKLCVNPLNLLLGFFVVCNLYSVLNSC